MLSHGHEQLIAIIDGLNPRASGSARKVDDGRPHFVARSRQPHIVKGDRAAAFNLSVLRSRKGAPEGVYFLLAPGLEYELLFIRRSPGLPQTARRERRHEQHQRQSRYY